MNIRLGIDASRSRSGGAQAHLIGIISQFDKSKHNIKEIHVWAFKELLNRLPNRPWLIKHNPVSLEKGLLSQLIWQRNGLKKELKAMDCDILFSHGASSLCSFQPMVALSQDMLSYEPGVMKYFGYGRARVRLILILLLQNLTFRRAAGVIFLSKYAGEIIQNSCGRLKNICYVPHGVDEIFNVQKLSDKTLSNDKKEVECIYVSNFDMYKHQWVVIEAVSGLRDSGYNIKLKLVGGGKGKARHLINKAINRFSKKGNFVEILEFTSHNKIPKLLAESDVFVFASSCENLPITLIEGMKLGLPIASSNRGPMPEVLRNGGIYFDPEDHISIQSAIKKILDDKDLRLSISRKAKSYAAKYNWSKCSQHTFKYISKVEADTKLS